MSNTIKVLFAVDFKAGSERAIKDLIAISQYRPMTITLMSVYNQHRFEERDHLYPAAALKQDEFKSKIKFGLEDKLEAWAKQHLGSIACERVIEFGEPAQIFSSYAKNFDWIVIGSNPHNIIEKIFMNSVAENILGQSDCAAMVLRRKLAGATEATVLVDLGDHPEEVIKRSFAWAKDMRVAKLNFVTYYPMPIEVAAFAAHSVSVFSGEELTKLLAELKSGLEKMVSKFAGDIQFSVEVKRVPASSVATEIAVDLKDHALPIVIGRKRRSALSQFFLGSVALGLKRSTQADLVILPIHE